MISEGVFSLRSLCFLLHVDKTGCQVSSLCFAGQMEPGAAGVSVSEIASCLHTTVAPCL